MRIFKTSNDKNIFVSEVLRTEHIQFYCNIFSLFTDYRQKTHKQDKHHLLLNNYAKHQ